MSWIGLPFESWYSFFRMVGGVVVDQHRLRRGRAAIEADDAAHDLAGSSVAS
jgi:hypothetical protein